MRIFVPKEEVLLQPRPSQNCFLLLHLLSFFSLQALPIRFFKVMLSNYGVSNALFNAVSIIQNASILVL